MAQRRRKDNRKQATQITRKEFLRQHKDRRQQRTLLAILAPVLVLVAMILGIGLYREVYQKSRVPVARVNGETISASAFAKRVTYDRRQLLATVDSYMAYLSSTDSGTLSSMFENMRTSVPDQTVSALVDEALIRQEARRRSIEVTNEEVDKKIYDDLATQIAPPAPTVAETEAEAGATQVSTDTVGSALTAAAALTSTETLTGTSALTATSGLAGTAAVTTTGELTATGGITATGGVTATAAVTATVSPDVLEAAFGDIVQPFLDTAGLTRSDYRDIVRQQLYREKLSAALGAEVSITANQVDAEYMAFDEPSLASAASGALKSGESWAQVLQRYRPPATPTPAAAQDAAAESLEPAPELAASEPITTSSALTLTGEITDTGSVTDTGAAAGLATPRPTTTPAPTALPDLYATEVGERDWLSQKDLMDTFAFTETVAADILKLGKGTASEPVSGGGKSYVFYVYDADTSRALPDDELQKLKDGALDAWLETARTAAQIDRFPLEGLVPAEPDWFIANWQQIVGTPQPTLDLSALDLETPQGAAPAGTPAGSQPTSAGPVVITVQPAPPSADQAGGEAAGPTP